MVQARSSVPAPSSFHSTRYHNGNLHHNISDRWPCGLFPGVRYIATVDAVLMAKYKPGLQGSNDPICNPESGDITIVVAGPRDCYCPETSSPGIGSATTTWPPRLYDIVFHFAVQYQCNPEQYNSTTSIRTRRSECASDVSYQGRDGCSASLQADVPSSRSRQVQVVRHSRPYRRSITSSITFPHHTPRDEHSDPYVVSTVGSWPFRRYRSTVGSTPDTVTSTSRNRTNHMFGSKNIYFHRS